ncbi:hypothetical protein [Leptothoe spongobia]|uniref:Uncharacterized protein n=1 Tax=Leptothoe spongobia TAU-MAC 1115 TaxID=1967444 RepID=A0A947DG48_9CYAN|nr:hypothetical protein [Leptothoe spongobia]MBT9316295.1 hypothetical protein [Leptothoe spongobia TAU-MAC 1115]
MTTYPALAGQPSPVFGERFTYPFDGKAVLRQVTDEFAREFNAGAIASIETSGESVHQRIAQFRRLTVTSAFPTSKDDCPRIALQRTGCAPQPSGIGLDYDEALVTLDDDTEAVRVSSSEVVKDTIEVSICTTNERLRDDLFTWYRMYLIDSVRHVLPQLRDYGFHDIRAIDAADGTVEYQGGQGQPGFQFYTAQIIVNATYELTVFRDVDVLKGFFNWQTAWPAEPLATGQVGETGDGQPPDSVFQPT